MIKLKIITITAMLAACISSCNVNGGETKTYEHKSGVWSSVDYKIEECTIDSCQYIIIFGSEGRNIIHKANCRNIVHACH
jgi:hypothetical protein